MQTIAGFLFVLIQLTIIILQIFAGLVGAFLFVISIHIKLIWEVYKWVMPKLYKKAIEWRFK